MQPRHLIVTHHAPDLDAIGAVWLLKRFDAQHYANARLGFVNPGETISLEAAEELGAQLHQITHVDTGLGEFDHHQTDRGEEYISASSLVYDHICHIHPELSTDEALKLLVSFITEIDHFGEIDWPDADNPRYTFMLHEVIRGLEFTELPDDDAQLHFGMTCLDGVYAALKQHVKAKEILDSQAEYFEIKYGRCMAVETKNDDTLKLAQKQGCILAIRKDSELGHVRIKARPDTEFDLSAVHEKVTQLDPRGTWYYHPSGKMLINGSRKHRNQTPTTLSLSQVIQAIQEVYA